MKKKGIKPQGKIKKNFDLKQIYDFWTQQALKYKQSPSASWSDHFVIEMERRVLIEYLSCDDWVLDVGCSNGHSTIELASQKRINIRGIDFIPEMIEQARLKAKISNDKLLGKIDFNIGNINALDEPTATYDKVIVVRVLINLGEWDKQLKGIEECIRVLKPGGMLLLSEATLQGWKQLNKFRKEWGLSEISIPPFNRYLDQDKLVKAVSSQLKLIKISNFASTYYIGTRLLKPLLSKFLNEDVNIANPDMEWNRWFSQLPSYGDYGTQKLFIFKKI